MTQEEILKGNKLIAKFDNRLNFKNDKGNFVEWIGINVERGNALSTNLKYHKSWDWLMPCIGKISNECEEPEELDGLKYALLTDNIEEAWEFVVDYLIGIDESV